MQMRPKVTPKHLLKGMPCSKAMKSSKNIKPVALTKGRFCLTKDISQIMFMIEIL